MGNTFIDYKPVINFGSFGKYSDQEAEEVYQSMIQEVFNYNPSLALDRQDLLVDNQWNKEALNELPEIILRQLLIILQRRSTEL